MNKYKKARVIQKIGMMFLVMIIATIVAGAFNMFGFPETNIVIIYILAIQILAWQVDSIPISIVASIIATLTFNYFFTSPYFTLSVHDSSYLITFAVMTFTSIITCTLTSISKKNALIAQEKEQETLALYQLTNHLTDAIDIEAITSIVIKTLSEYLNTNVGLLCFDEDGMPENTYIQRRNSDVQIRREVVGKTELKHNIENLRVGCDKTEEFHDWPIYGSEHILGIIRIPTETGCKMTETQFNFLHSVIESTSLAMDRIRVAEQRVKERDQAIQERYRTTLLRSISHDLRTPLSSIMGTSEMLSDILTQYDNEQCNTLINSIYNDANWLYSLVENILSLTRLQEGKLVIGKQIEIVEEVISSALERFSIKALNREIDVRIPDEPVMIPIDAKLIEQLLLNLLDNAYKHTNPEDEISIVVEQDDLNKHVKFIIRDGGSGISQADYPHIFELFYTSSASKSPEKSSLGLGLPICDAIIKAHHGTLKIMNRTHSKGVEVIFTLPMEEKDE